MKAKLRSYNINWHIILQMKVYSKLISQKKKELNSIHDVRIKHRMLNNKIAVYEDYEQNKYFFY